MNNPESSRSGRPGYLETLALRTEPFAEGIDSRFFYAGAALMQRLDLLTHLTQFGNSVVLVSGPTGSGKTTLLSRFIGKSSNLWRLCLIDAADDFSHFLNRLADALVSDSFTSEQELLTEWANRSDSSQLLVILIDNAENLDTAALERLCAMMNQAEADRIRFILFGLPEAQQRLKQAFEQKTACGAIQCLEMPRLNEEETSSYLMYRLAVAGYSGESPFTATEVRAMCKAADGRPGDLNRLAHQALLERQARTTNNRIPLGIGRRRFNGLGWGIAAVGVLAVTVYLGWQQFYSTPVGTMPSNDLIRPSQEHPLVLPEPRTLPKPEQSARIVEETRQNNSTATVAVSPAAGIGGAESIQPSATTDSPSPDTATPFAPLPAKDELLGPPAEAAVTGVTPDPKTQKETTQSPASSQQISAAEPVSPPSPKPDTQEKMPPSASPDRLSRAEPAGRPTPQPEKPATPVEKDDAVPTPVAQKAAKGSDPHRESWLLKQPEASFSLQLAGSRNEALIADFVRRYKLDERQAAYYRGQHEGAPWYVLMYGVYPSREAALEGRDNLPYQLRQAKPWPRSFKSVHASIREAQ